MSLKINDAPFVLPPSVMPPSEGIYAPLVTAMRDEDNIVVLRVMVLTTTDIVTPPQFSPNGPQQLSEHKWEWDIEYATNEIGTDGYQAWYVEQSTAAIPAPSDGEPVDITVSLKDGNPRKTSRGTVVIIQSTLD